MKILKSSQHVRILILIILCSFVEREGQSESNQPAMIFTLYDKSKKSALNEYDNVRFSGNPDSLSDSLQHTSSRFKLKGKHAGLNCSDCHVESVENPIDSLSCECSSCHTDVHNGQFAVRYYEKSLTRCERCHSADGWREPTFDHNRDSKFALTGAHTRVDCWECHPAIKDTGGNVYIKYKPLDSFCASCHDKS